ncbi:MAG: glycosyltransferase family 2 protein [Sporolactobacillus sp.]
MNKKVVCIVVTYNRLPLLKECIAAISEQSYPVHTILVVNNNSSDGTTEYLQTLSDDAIQVLNLAENMGGAGGFYAGIKAAYTKTDCEYYWMMDDDTIPESDCLEELMKSEEALHGNFGFLASQPIWIDGNPNLMNIPRPSKVWNRMVSKDLIQVECATFVSVLLNKVAVERVGLPYKEFFIWSDDIEYTMRIDDVMPGYFVGKSKAVHKTKNNVGSDIVTDSADRVSRYFYAYRNYFYTQKKYLGFEGIAKQIAKLFVMIFQILAKSKGQKSKRIGTISRGLICGLFFHPKVEYLHSKEV